MTDVRDNAAVGKERPASHFDTIADQGGELDYDKVGLAEEHEHPDEGLVRPY